MRAGLQQVSHFENYPEAFLFFRLFQHTSVFIQIVKTRLLNASSCKNKYQEALTMIARKLLIVELYN